MPELPEVQTVINGLMEAVIHKKIISIEEFRAGTIIWNCPKGDFGDIIDIARRGKYIIINTSLQFKIVIHLRMTGKLIYLDNYNFTTPHTRAEILFSDKTKLIFDDVRTFGKIEIYKFNIPVKALDTLGVEPLSSDLNYTYLRGKLKNRKAPVKNILLDQNIIAGLGNIYVNEILFRARINPLISGSELKKKQINEIIFQTKQVLNEAIKYNGTTISDFRSVNNKTGEFQRFLKVYNKKKCECNSDLVRIKQAGRSTFYCPKCQKI
jgi:formamidopyrimidine-DNA glycosylase